MNTPRRIAILPFCCFVATTALGSRAAEHEATLRGANWLVSQQDDDGSWRSATYGQMQNGAGNTALVLDALTRMPANWRKTQHSAIGRGFQFLLANLDDDGYVSAPRHSADFPTYSTALLLAAIERSYPKQWQDTRQKMRAYLLRIQRLDAIERDQYGGWPQIGGEPGDAAAESNVNISVSRFAAVALSRSDPIPVQSRKAALLFLQRCRNPSDGGYFFTPAVDNPLNKAGQISSGMPRAYGTATADAILAQLAWGVPRNHPEVLAAIHWLESQPSPDVVPGFSAPGQGVVAAEEALRFYYWAALAQVIERFPESKLKAHRATLRSLILNEQRSDGSWRNANSLMREDDPLIATAFALTTLASLDAPAVD